MFSNDGNFNKVKLMKFPLDDTQRALGIAAVELVTVASAQSASAQKKNKSGRARSEDGTWSHRVLQAEHQDMINAGCIAPTRMLAARYGISVTMIKNFLTENIVENKNKDPLVPHSHDPFERCKAPLGFLASTNDEAKTNNNSPEVFTGKKSDEVVTYDPGRLLDALIEKFHLKSDAALSRVLSVAPPIISKIRNRRLQIGASMLIRMHEESELTIAELRTLLGDPEKNPH